MSRSQRSLRIFAILSFALGTLDILYAAMEVSQVTMPVIYFVAGGLAIVFGLAALWATFDPSKAPVARIIGILMFVVEIVNIVLGFRNGLSVSDTISAFIRLMVDLYLILLLNELIRENREKKEKEEEKKEEEKKEA